MLDPDLQLVLQRAGRARSAARLRQLRWVAGELMLAREHPEFPDSARASVRTLLEPAASATYLELARDGALRRRRTAGNPHATDASMRIRVDCLRLLREAAAVTVDEVDRPEMPQLRATVDGPSRSRLRDYLAAHSGPSAPPGRVRLLAIVGVVLDTGARVGEMCAMTVHDLAADRASLLVERRPQARTAAPAESETVHLSTGTRVALGHWLDVRAQLVDPLEGGKDALWVSVRANHAGAPNAAGVPIPRPPGMPLRPRGLQRAYTRAVTEANGALLGAPGWQPLPHRFEQLRRAVIPRLEESAATRRT
ncbi:MAG: tyrosine-type recombinase/integrase [Mycobacteriaceae bacterium]|nr:tyrosine-type recombinase/integrase [Mycobacteriaceae bacterium]